MAVTKRYTAPEQVIASYDYFDIQEGTGYVSYYLAFGTDEKIVTTRNLASNGVVSSGQVDDEINWVTIFDHDYDITFNTPRTIKGKLLASFSQGIYAATAGENVYSRVTIYIRKWDGISETEIANNVSDVINVAGVATKSSTELLEINVPITLFKAGEILRITILQEGKDQDATCDGNVGYGHDPADRNDDFADRTGVAARKVINDTETTKFQVDVPFKLT